MWAAAMFAGCYRCLESCLEDSCSVRVCLIEMLSTPWPRHLHGILLITDGCLSTFWLCPSGGSLSFLSREAYICVALLLTFEQSIEAVASAIMTSAMAAWAQGEAVFHAMLTCPCLALQASGFEESMK